MITPENASKKIIFPYSLTAPPSMEIEVIEIAVHNTGKSIGKDIRANSELPELAFATIAPKIAATDEIAMLPDKTTAQNRIG